MQCDSTVTMTREAIPEYTAQLAPLSPAIMWAHGESHTGGKEMVELRIGAVGKPDDLSVESSR